MTVDALMSGTSCGLLRRTVVDLYGPGNSPQKRKVGGSPPPLTTRFRSISQPSHLR
jgi:hypothetical protein